MNVCELVRLEDIMEECNLGYFAIDSDPMEACSMRPSFCSRMWNGYFQPLRKHSAKEILHLSYSFPHKQWLL